MSGICRVPIDELHGPAWAESILIRQEQGGCAIFEIDAGDKPLPMGLVGALGGAQSRLAELGCTLSVTRVAADSRLALHVFKLARLLPQAASAGAEDLADPSFRVRANGETLHIEVDKAALGDDRLGRPSSHRWLAGLTPSTVILDLRLLEHVNSVLVAWMLQLAHASKPIVIEVRKANRQIATQMAQLRLNVLMKLVEG